MQKLENSKVNKGRDAKVFIIFILVIELVLIIPWLVLAALWGTAVFTDFNLVGFFLVLPIFSYPLYIILFVIISYKLFKRQRFDAASGIILIPPLIPMLYHVILMFVFGLMDR
jgi:hypothetical protein